jgi:hypothetical protein
MVLPEIVFIIFISPFQFRNELKFALFFHEEVQKFDPLKVVCEILVIHAAVGQLCAKRQRRRSVDQ